MFSFSGTGVRPAMRVRISDWLTPGSLSVDFLGPGAPEERRKNHQHDQDLFHSIPPIIFITFSTAGSAAAAAQKLETPGVTS